MVTTKQIVERLIEAMPPPRAAPPRPQSSWASLKERDVLRRPDSFRGLGDQVAGLWEVVSVNSEGATLSLLGGSEQIELTDRNWKEAGWRKLAKRELTKLEKTDD